MFKTAEILVYFMHASSKNMPYVSYLVSYLC